MRRTIVSTIKATVKDRRLEIDVPTDWPDGTEVEIHPVRARSVGDGETLSAAEIAETLAAMDRIEPFEMTAPEEAAWQAERQARKQREKAAFAEHADELRRMWE
jgi:hypothetical protein